MIKNIRTNLFRFKSQIDLSEIHQTSLRILEEIGIPLPSEKALGLLESAGCKVDFDKQRVWIFTKDNFAA